MRIAIIADTHMPRGSRRLRGACLGHLRAADLIVHAGDFVTAAVFAEIEAIGPPVAAVYGNVDDEALRRDLPEERVVEVAGARVGLVHDAGAARGRLGRLRRRFPDADAAIFGHSHLPLHERDGGFQIFNPGSPTERRRAPHRSMGLATVDHGEIRFEHVWLD
ncbi:MAG: YfcE family phosphodiesterase [Thermoleophilaceae bacterium]|nr:YfcE family phosphodiesterase [Thermoleophilaceae bacterium]